MQAPWIGHDDAAPHLTWSGLIDALRAGHRRPPAAVSDMLLGPSGAALLGRGAHIEGLGYGVKAVTIVEANAARGLPTVQGAMFVFAPDDGRLVAMIDSRLVTEFKTAADSVLGARLLARPDSRRLLIVGAGAVARSLVAAYAAAFPALERVQVWARRADQAAALAAAAAETRVAVEAVTDLAAAAAEADVVATATLSREPVLRRAWIRPGTHVDLIGAFTPEMREADDGLVSVGRLFVDSRDTTVGHIGELTIPIARGVITAASVAGDLYDLVAGRAGRRSADDITLFKNGGGAHLDLMTAVHIIDRLRERAARSGRPD